MPPAAALSLHLPTSKSKVVIPNMGHNLEVSNTELRILLDPASDSYYFTITLQHVGSTEDPIAFKFSV